MRYIVHSSFVAGERAGQAWLILVLSNSEVCVKILALADPIPGSLQHTIQHVVDVAQLARAPDCGSGSRGFKSHHPPQTGPLFMQGFFFSKSALRECK